MTKHVWALVAATTLATIARAEEPTFEGLGQASLAAQDRVRARERALDEAFRQAVEQATATVLEPDALVARSSELRLRIYPHARGYVTNYRVLDEGEQSGVFQVHIQAEVATARLAHDLAPAPATAPRTRLFVCATATLLSGARSPASAPASAPEDNAREVREASGAAAQALADSARTRHLEVVGGRRCEGERPGDLGRASAAAPEALLGAVTLTRGGAIRGTALQAVHAQAEVRWVDASGKVVAEGREEADRYDGRLERAQVAGARQTVVEAARALFAQRHRGSESKEGSGGDESVVRVRVHGAARYGDYVAVLRALEALPGVAGVEPRRFTVGSAELIVHTASSPKQLNALLERAAPRTVHLAARLGAGLEGDALIIEVTSETLAPEPG